MGSCRGEKGYRQQFSAAELLLLLFVGCLTSQQHACVYLRDGSAQKSLRASAATLR